MSAGEIANRFACKWPTVSRHLRQLEHAKLVSIKKEGREHIYQLNKKTLNKVIGNWLNWFK